MSGLSAGTREAVCRAVERVRWLVARHGLMRTFAFGGGFFSIL